MSDYTRSAKYVVSTYNRWGYPSGEICGNNRRELSKYIQGHYMDWLTLADINRMIQLNK